MEQSMALPLCCPVEVVVDFGGCSALEWFPESAVRIDGFVDDH